MHSIIVSSFHTPCTAVVTVRRLVLLGGSSLCVTAVVGSPVSRGNRVGDGDRGPEQAFWVDWPMSGPAGPCAAKRDIVVFAGGEAVPERLPLVRPGERFPP